MRHVFLPFQLAIAGALCAQATQQSPHASTAPADALQFARPSAMTRVLHDEPNPGTSWARGRTWKACFASTGCTVVPFFGSQAPRNFPLQFAITAVRVGGRELEFSPTAAPVRDGDRVTFDRVGIREVYDLALDSIEQHFIVESSMPGDVAVELAVTTELTELADVPGIQWANEHGRVDYGDAFLVDGDDRLALPSRFDGRHVCITVPAGMRRGDVVHIDPLVLFTSPSGGAPTLPEVSPDISWDADSNLFLLAWESRFSLTDSDAFCEFFDGEVLWSVGGTRVLDLSSDSYRQPRVANLNFANRFLIVMEAIKPVHVWSPMIYGRLRDAAPTAGVQPEFLISSPQAAQYYADIDVGGDPGDTPNNHGFCVVSTGRGQMDQLFCHFVDASGNVVGTAIHGHTGKHVRAPRISDGNGRGQVPEPHWFVAYSVQAQVLLESDVLVLPVTPTGTLGTPLDIALGPDDTVQPIVASPITDPAGSLTQTLVVYRNTTLGTSRARLVSRLPGQATWTATTATSLAGFGLGPDNIAGESDGSRFAVATTTGANGPMQVAALAPWPLNSLALHELEPAPVGPLHTAVRMTSKHATGGQGVDYAVAFQVLPSQPRVWFARYRGYSGGAQVVQRPLACDAMWTLVSGQPLPGTAMDFSSGGIIGVIYGHAFGLPSPLPIPVCPTCMLGLRPDQPILLQLGSWNWRLHIPNNVALVGNTYAIQAIAVGAFACLGGITLGDAVEITIR